MPHPYDSIVKHFRAAFDAICAAGIRDSVAKGGVGEILLAHHLGHTLCDSDKGADGQDDQGKAFEYKVSITDQFNFHFGTRESTDPPEQKVRRHFVGIEGAVCAKRNAADILTAVYIPSDSLVDDLVAHFQGTRGSQLIKNYSLENLLKLQGAHEIV